MSVYLIGGGWSDEYAPAVFGPFLAECGKNAGRSSPKVRLVVMGTDSESREYHERYVAALALAGEHELLVTRVPFGEACPAETLEGIDDLLVGGGPTPEYHQALSPLYSRIRDLVTGGLPYAGFSAGAALGATTAIIGGWRVNDVAVCPDDAVHSLGMPGIWNRSRSCLASAWSTARLTCTLPSGGRSADWWRRWIRSWSRAGSP